MDLVKKVPWNHGSHQSGSISCQNHSFTRILDSISNLGWWWQIWIVSVDEDIQMWIDA